MKQMFAAVLLTAFASPAMASQSLSIGSTLTMAVIVFLAMVATAWLTRRRAKRRVARLNRQVDTHQSLIQELDRKYQRMLALFVLQAKRDAKIYDHAAMLSEADLESMRWYLKDARSEALTLAQLFDADGAEATTLASFLHQELGQEACQHSLNIINEAELLLPGQYQRIIAYVIKITSKRLADHENCQLAIRARHDDDVLTLTFEDNANLPVKSSGRVDLKKAGYFAASVACEYFGGKLKAKTDTSSVVRLRLPMDPILSAHAGNPDNHPDNHPDAH